MHKRLVPLVILVLLALAGTAQAGLFNLSPNYQDTSGSCGAYADAESCFWSDSGNFASSTTICRADFAQESTWCYTRTNMCQTEPCTIHSCARAAVSSGWCTCDPKTGYVTGSCGFKW